MPASARRLYVSEEKHTEHRATIGIEEWRRAMTMPARPPLSRRRKLARAVKDLRWRLSQWIDPYY
jgi:hypothetical protein